jgi:hypothetical protein
MSKYRVMRGGRYSDSRGLRSTFRYRDEPEGRRWVNGFRIVIRRKP